MCVCLFILSQLYLQQVMEVDMKVDKESKRMRGRYRLSVCSVIAEARYTCLLLICTLCLYLLLSDGCSLSPPPGFGFVEFADPSVVDKVVQLHFHQINNKSVCTFHLTSCFCCPSSHPVASLVTL